MMTSTLTLLQVRPANWLPLPGRRLHSAEPEPVVDEQDLFTKGDVVRFYPQQGYGFVRSAKGEEIFFRLTELNLVGPKAEKKYLRVGSRVGYDVSWTSHGLHIRVMKIY